MRHIKLILVLILVPFISFAQLDRSKRPVAKPAKELQIGSYNAHVLSNGLKVFIVENNKLPRIAMSIIFDYDPILEGPICGVGDLTGQLLKTGTKNRTKAEIDDAIDFIGADLSTSATSIYAASLSKHKETLLDVLSDVIINAKFSETELDKARTQMISGLAASKNSPEAIMQRLEKLLVYGESHPYGESPTEATLKNITLADCQKLYSENIRPNISYMAIVGDVKTEEIIPLLEKYLSSWERKDVPTRKYNLPKAPEQNTVSIVDRPNAVQSSITVAMPIELKPGTEDAMKARLMNSILGGGTSRLFDNLREKHGFTYGAYSSISADELVGIFSASSDVRNSATDSAITEILYEINRITKEPVTTEEITLHKNEISGGFALSLESPQTIASFALSTERYGLDKDYYKNYLKKLEAINIADLQNIAGKYLKPSNIHILVVGKAEEVAEGLKKFNPKGIINYYDEEGKAYDPTKKLKPAPEGMTAETVIENYLTAVGGRKNLAKVKDETRIYATMMQGMLIEMKTVQKAPNMFLSEVSGGGMVFMKQTFDGEKAVNTQPMSGETEVLEGDDLEKMKLQAIFNAELDYKKHGYTLTLEGIEEIDGKETYKVNFMDPNGSKHTEYYDIATSFKVKSMDKDGVTKFGDYKAFKKIKYPGKISQDMQGQTIEFELKSVVVNSKPADSLFKAE